MRSISGTAYLLMQFDSDLSEQVIADRVRVDLRVGLADYERRRPFPRRCQHAE